MQREEKQLDNSIERLTQRVHDVKNSISALIAKLETEYETLQWPTVLDSFALISGQINSLNKALKHDKAPLLKNYCVLPLDLSRDRDTNLEKLTEGRVFVFNHDVVPDYLRTKPEPSIEESQQQLSVRASTISADNVQKQINSLNKVCNNLVEIIQSFKDESESESQKHKLQETSSAEDTKLLLGAIVSGRGLKKLTSPAPGNRQVEHPQQKPQARQGPNVPTPTINMKSMSSVKTNIKAAGPHPYGR